MKTKMVLFWKSVGRASTTEYVVFELPANMSEDDIKDKVEAWCSRDSSWYTAESIQYGHKVVKTLPRKELTDKWDIVCKKKHKIDEEYNIARAMLLSSKPHLESEFFYEGSSKKTVK